MADKEKLKDMLDSIIDDNSDKAEVDFHEYLQGKMKEVIGGEDAAAAAADDEVVATDDE